MSSDLFRRYIDIVEQAVPPIPGVPTGRKEMPAPRPATQDEINGLAAMSKSHTLAPDLMIYWWQDPKLKEFTKEQWQELKNKLADARAKYQKYPAIPRTSDTPAAASGTAVKPATPALDRVRAGNPSSTLNRVRAGMAARGAGMSESKSLTDYIAESERAFGRPVAGDYFAINIREETLFETYVCDETEDGIVIYADDVGMQLLEDYGYLGETLKENHDFDYEADSDGSEVDVVDQGEYDFEGDQAQDQLQSIVRAARRLNGMLDDEDNLPEWVQMKITKAEDYLDTAADYVESNRQQAMAEGREDDDEGELCHMCAGTGEGRHESETCDHCHGTGYEPVEDHDWYADWSPEENIRDRSDEAKYQGREVPLGKPMKGDVKKSKVYVRGPKGNVVKVNFGQKGMKIKKNIPGRRKNFRARHNCDNPGPRWKARYWSCRAW